MIRAIYRWRVKSGEEEKFIQAWMQGTAAIRGKSYRGWWEPAYGGARFISTEFLTALACWNSIEHWQAFAADNDSAPPYLEAFRAMGCSKRAHFYRDLKGVPYLLICVR